MHPGNFYTRLKASPRISRWMTPVVRKVWSWERDLRRWLPLAYVPGLKQWSGRPRGFWPRAEDYLAVAQAMGGVRVVYPAGSGTRTWPQDAGGAVPEAFKRVAPLAWPAGRVIELKDVRLVGGYGGSVIAADGRLVAELSPDIWGITRHELFSRLQLPKATRLDGVTLMVATPEAPDNYSHWLFDLLPRLLMVEKAGWRLAELDHVVINAGAAAFCGDTLAALGVPAAKVRRLGAADAYRAERMISGSLRGEPWWDSLPPDVCAELAARLLPAGAGRGGFPRRLYLSRTGAKFRRLVNEEEVVALFKAQGFEEFYPERHSFAEQVAAFRDAELVAGPHGAAFCNLLFCAEGTGVLEIHAPSHFNVSYWTLSSYRKLNYTAVMGEPLSAETEKRIAAPSEGGNRGTKFLNFKVEAAALRGRIAEFVRGAGRQGRNG